MKEKTWNRTPVEEILNRLEAGMTVGEIALALDISKAAIHTRLSRNKVSLTPYREARNLEILECYEQHGTRVTAAKYNVCETAIWMLASRYRKKQLKKGEEDGRTEEPKTTT